MHKTLNDTYAKSPCAYCRKHCCSLTVKQLKGRECLKKNCWYLVKYPEHEWWKQRELLKAKKKAKRKEMCTL